MANNPEISSQRLDEALDVMFGDGSDEEIQQWFAEQPDGQELSQAILAGMLNDSRENRSRRQSAHG